MHNTEDNEKITILTHSIVLALATNQELNIKRRDLLRSDVNKQWVYATHLRRCKNICLGTISIRRWKIFQKLASPQRKLRQINVWNRIDDQLGGPQLRMCLFVQAITGVADQDLVIF